MRGQEAGYNVLEHDVHGGSDAPFDGVVHTVLWGVRGVSNHDTTECLFAELAAQFIRNLSEDRATEHTEFGCVRLDESEEGQRYTARKVQLYD
jgi:hypothetical protein